MVTAEMVTTDIITMDTMTTGMVTAGMGGDMGTEATEIAVVGAGEPT
jgi:hypothetical protein